MDERTRRTRDKPAHAERQRIAQGRPINDDNGMAAAQPEQELVWIDVTQGDAKYEEQADGLGRYRHREIGMTNGDTPERPWVDGPAPDTVVHEEGIGMDEDHNEGADPTNAEHNAALDADEKDDGK